MVVVQRNEVSRNRLLSLLTVVFSISALIAVFFYFSQASQLGQLALAVLGTAAALALILSAVQLYTHPKRSQVLIFQNDEEMVIATNALHEGFKLRFLRDILGESLTAFSDEDRVKWKPLEADGFYATLYVRGVRKVVMLRLCMMVFDDVFVADRSNRWEHHDSSNTAEPSFSKREMPHLTGWKSS